MTREKRRISVSPRVKKIYAVLWLVFFLNLFVAAAKFIYGLSTYSAAMQADGVHSAFDAAGNIIALLGLAFSARPADEGHPYGHAKFETYASFLIGVLLLGAALGIALPAFETIQGSSTQAEVHPASFLIMVMTLLINGGVSWYERRQAHELKSPILRADAAHTASDAFVSLGVIVGLGLVACGIGIADAYVALGVTVLILISAGKVLHQALSTLADHRRLPAEDIIACVLENPHVQDVHKVRTRGTEAEIYVDLHVLVLPDMSVRRAHEVSELIADSIQERFPDVCEVLVHIEPADGHVDL